MAIKDKPRILVADDEESLCEILKFNLEAEGYAVDTVSCAEDVLTMPVEAYSLMILDVMMGAMSGFNLARRLKSNAATADIPIIFCTAKDSETDTIEGLDIGADDYIAKPFSIREVLARVRSVLRRTTPRSEGEKISFEGLVLDMRSKTCTIDGNETALTKTEFEILLLLISNRGKIFSREEILRRVWDGEVVVLDRTVDVNITRLRRKTGIYGTHIVTKQGYGYGFKE